MTTSNCYCKKSDCTTIAVISAIIIGIITAFLRITGVITITSAFLWVVFGIAVVYLAVALVAVSLNSHAIMDCSCNCVYTLLISVLGTILAALILLAIDFVTTSIAGAIISGALLLFFWQTLSTTACLIKCIAGCND